MKIQIKTLLATMCTVLLCFTSVLYSSCSKIKCMDVSCQHGGTCDKGKCNCPSNYEGNNCENGLNKRYAGTYTGSSCDGTQGTLTISASANDPGKIIFVEMSGLYGTVSGNTFVIPYQTFFSNGDQFSVTGSGTLSENSIYISTFSTDLTSGGSGACSFTGTK